MSSLKTAPFLTTPWKVKKLLGEKSAQDMSAPELYILNTVPWKIWLGKFNY
jgi:hypothetical protein